MRALLADLRHALRLYRRTPVSSLIAVAVLAIAMAFVSAFLSLYVDLVLRPHPGFEDSGRIVSVGQNDGVRLFGVPYALIERMGEEVAMLDSVVGVMAFSQELGPENESTIIEFVTRGFTSGLRPRLALGRGFEDGEHDPEAERVAIVSYDYWQEKLNGDPAVLDTTIELELRSQMIFIGPDGEPQPAEGERADFRIIGVMSRDMPGLQTDETALWLPIERAGALLFGNAEQYRQMSLQTFGRLNPGGSADALARQISTRYADSAEFLFRSGARLDAVGGVVRDINVYRDAKQQLQLFLTASVLLALVAASNVSLFLLARAPGRRRELGIRMAVGAPLRRLARQLATESALLVIVAAFLGLLLSLWLSGVLRGLAFLRRAQWTNVSVIDWRVLSLVGVFLLILTLLVSLAPVLGLKRLGIAASSRQVAARATLAQRIAGTAQLAIAGALAGAAVGFGWYLSGLVFEYPGYATENIYAVSFQPRDRGAISFRAGLENAVVEAQRRREAIAALPGVSRVGFGSPVPGLNSGIGIVAIADPEDPNRRLRARIGSLDSSFLDVVQYRLVAGRAPTDSDTAVALVNQALALDYFGREDVVGETLPFAVPGGERTEVIGVLEDLSFGHPRADVEPVLFTTSNSAFFFATAAVIESTLSAAELEQQLRALVDSGGLELAVASVAPLATLRSDLLAADRARSLLTIGTAALVVVLAALGFYGTQRYLVTAGRREYAIRASLGAGPTALGRLVMARGLRLGLPGLVLGTLLAFIAVAWLRDDFLSGEVSSGPIALVVALALVVLVLAASLGPARLARRTQPAPLLREE